MFPNYTRVENCFKNLIKQWGGVEHLNLPRVCTPLVEINIRHSQNGIILDFEPLKIIEFALRVDDLNQSARTSILLDNHLSIVKFFPSLWQKIFFRLLKR